VFKIKRSEMILLMEKYFDTRTASSMDELLSIIEKLGMFPPRNAKATFEQQLERSYNNQNGLHFWEDEKDAYHETILGGKVKFSFISEEHKSFYGDKVFDGTFIRKGNECFIESLVNATYDEIRDCGYDYFKLDDVKFEMV